MDNTEIKEILDEANKKKELVNAEARKNYMKRKAEGRLTYKLIPKSEYKKRGPKAKITATETETKELKPEPEEPKQKTRGCKAIIIDNIDMIPENIKKLMKPHKIKPLKEQMKMIKDDIIFY